MVQGMPSWCTTSDRLSKDVTSHQRRIDIEVTKGADVDKDRCRASDAARWRCAVAMK